MHTQGKLKVIEADEYCGPYITDQIGETVADLYFMTRPDTPHRFANCNDNARRLVACWNACEGIETETLEAMRLGDMRLDFAPDLLKMLDMMIWYYEAFRDESPVGPTERDDIALARKVLAAARGEEVTA